MEVPRSNMAARIAAIFVLSLLFTAAPSWAQTTYFQVPSADVPAPGQARAQLQGMGSGDAEFEAMLVLGVGHDVEVGATLLNLAYDLSRVAIRARQNHDDRTQPLAPLWLVTAQKLFELHELVGVSLGVQTGSEFVDPARARFVGRGYALLVLDFDHWGRCSAGPYVATPTFLGERQRTGGFLGCELDLVRNVFGVDVDWDLGAHALGAASFGPRLHMGEHSVISAGVRVPNAWGSAAWGGLLQLELTYPGRQD
jgi:hypothetical protein